MFPCMFLVNNMTQLDATLAHSLNKDCSHWEAEEELASSRSTDWKAQRRADMSFHQWWLTLAQGEAAGWSDWWGRWWWEWVGVVRGTMDLWLCDWWTYTSPKTSSWKNKGPWISPLSIHQCQNLFLLCVHASQQSIDTGASTNGYFECPVIL